MMRPAWIIPASILAFAAALTAIVEKSERDAYAQWEAFRVSHNCAVTARMQGETSTSTGFVTNFNDGSVSPVTTVNATPDKTGWTCNDGVTYWRNEP